MNRSLAYRAALLVLAAIAAAWTLFPFAWYFLVSLTTPGHIPRSLSLPDKLSLQPYVSALFGGGTEGVTANYSILPNIINSFIVAGMTVLGCVVLGFGAAYVFSRGRSATLNVLFNALLVIRMTPAVSLAVPIYLMINAYGLADTHLGLSIVHIMLSLPLAIWLLKGFIDGIPAELEEAALMDGATVVQVLRYVILPLAAPGVAVAASFVFLASYIEFMFASILSRGSADTLPIAIAGYNSDHQTFYNEMAAASFMSMIPLFVFFYFAGKYMVRGLTMGAVK